MLSAPGIARVHQAVSVTDHLAKKRRDGTEFACASVDRQMDPLVDERSRQRQVRFLSPARQFVDERFQSRFVLLLQFVQVRHSHRLARIKRDSLAASFGDVWVPGNPVGVGLDTDDAVN